MADLHSVPWTTCPVTGKRAYTSRKNAKAALLKLAHGGRNRMRPYECDECGKWHIGHMPGRVRAGEVSAADYYANVPIEEAS